MGCEDRPGFVAFGTTSSPVFMVPAALTPHGKDRDRSLRVAEAVRLLESLGYTVTPPRR